MYRMRRGWRFAVVATGVALVALTSGCSSDNLSLIYNVATLLLDALSTAATAST